MNNTAIKLPSILDLDSDCEFVSEESRGKWVPQYLDGSTWRKFDYPAFYPTEAEACQALIDTRE